MRKRKFIGLFQEAAGNRSGSTVVADVVEEIDIITGMTMMGWQTFAFASTVKQFAKSGSLWRSI